MLEVRLEVRLPISRPYAVVLSVSVSYFQWSHGVQYFTMCYMLGNFYGVDSSENVQLKTFIKLTLNYSPNYTYFWDANTKATILLSHLLDGETEAQLLNCQ